MSSASRKLIQAAGGGGPADPGDDDFANVVLLLDGDGTSGDENNTFTDSSTNGFTVTETGSVVQGSFSPYGDNWSNYLDYDAYINNVRNISSNPLGTQDFTIEFFFNATEENGSYKSIYGEGYTVQIYYKDNSIRTWFSSSDNTSGYFITSLTPGGTPTPGQWHHFAVVRNGNTFTAYLDGVGGTSQTSSTAVGTAGFAATIGANALSISSYEYSGYVSNFRMVIGTAVYTSDFTPPTSPLTAITNTEVLTCSSNAFKDESTNNHSLSPATTGTDLPKVTPFSPFRNDDARDITTDGGSGLSKTSSDYLAVSSSINAKFGSSDFTVEGWIYPEDLNDQYNTIFDYGTNAGTTGAWWALHAGSSGTIEFHTNNGSLKILSASGAVRVGEWNHFAVVRSGTLFIVYVNGVNLGSTSASYNMTDSNTRTLYAYYQANSGRNFNGYLSDTRIVRGTAVYTSPFTPPTSPLTAVTNTELLLNFQDAGIYDRTGLNNIDTVGNAQIDTAVKKYGTGSMEFDGTGDYLRTIENEALQLGSGDWTLEFWVYFNAVNDGVIRYLFEWRTSADTSNAFLAQETNGNWTYQNGAGSGLSSGMNSSTFSVNTWYHVAISRNGTTIRFFVDGTSTNAPTDSSNYDSGTLTIGSRYNAQNYLNGYIDDFRITKGIARYTSNFTAPDAELPKF